VRTLRDIFRALGVSEARMERGNVRADVNVSLRESPDAPLGTRTETKNVNTFRGIEQVVRYEIQRQAAILAAGGEVLQETRHGQADGTTRDGRVTHAADACRACLASGEVPEELSVQVTTALRGVEEELGRELGAAEDPLLVSVRSGAKFSMPGMMETVLNIGLNDVSVQGLAAASSDERFAWDSYRRLIQMFGKTVLDIDGDHFSDALDAKKDARGVSMDYELPVDALQELVEEYKAIVKEHAGIDFPQDPRSQLDMATEAVFRSWTPERAHIYRRREKIPHDLGTAVNVCTMVFGNMGETSGTGVCFTRDPSTGRTLPDRYIEGTCPICGAEGARGDQCDTCGNQLDPTDLISPRSRINGETPEFVETTHWFLDLPALAQALGAWLDEREASGTWRPNVIKFSQNLLGDIRPRAMTRDIDWGIPVPGWEDQPTKRLYVWFDAVIGYLSASVEWARRSGDPEAWRAWWNDPQALSYYFMGKDNIVFHSQIWPAELLGYNGQGESGGEPGRLRGNSE